MHAGPVESQSSHVADVKKTYTLSDCLVLFHDRRVLHRHGPAAEFDKTAAVSAMPFVKGRLKQRGVRRQGSLGQSF